MKQLLFLLLFPCLAIAQYQGNGNQKITLGEQTTADGLVYRGVENDTALITPFSDTSAYIILDTINNKFYNYNRSTNVWSLAGGGGGGGGTGTVTSITAGTGLTGGTITTSGTLAADTNFLVTRFDTSSMLTNYYSAGRNGIIQAADVPTLNQNTTGSAATLTTARNIRTNLASAYGANFNGSTDITPGVSGVLGAGNGGTGASNFGSPNRIPFVSSSGSLTTDTFFAYNGTTQKLGVGVPNPTEKLHVNGNGLFTGSTLTVSNSAGAGFANFGSADGRAQYQYNNFGGRTVGEYGWQFGRSANPGFLPDAYFIYNVRKGNVALGIDTNSNVGIGTNFTMPTQRLHVVGNARITAVGALGGNSATLYRNSDGVLSTTSSDINKKHNVRPIIYGLETINQLNPVNFQWNVDESEDIGFIAQDIQNIIPESIETDWDSNLIFKYEKLIPILTKAIQEQQALIKALEQRILTLENK